MMGNRRGYRDTENELLTSTNRARDISLEGRSSCLDAPLDHVKGNRRWNYVPNRMSWQRYGVERRHSLLEELRKRKTSPSMNPA